MATKRIDIVVYNGQVRVEPVQGYAEVQPKDGKYLITTGSWSILVSPESINIYCSSKAIKKRNRFKIATMNGSLFLYNSTNNWYWYFRKKKLQFILDVNKVDNVKMCETHVVELPCCVSLKDNVISESSIEKSPSLKYDGDNVTAVLDKTNMIIDSDDSSIAMVTIKFKFDKFLIVEFLPNHRKLFIHKNYRIEDLFADGYLKMIDVKSVINDLSVKGS
jgi:hypothetical protein